MARQWDEASFFEELKKEKGDAACAVARRILEWCARRGYEVEYGLGDNWGTLKPCIQHGGRKYVLFEVFTPGFALLVSYLWEEEPFTSDDSRKQLINQMNELPLKKKLPEDARNDRPRVQLDSFAPDEEFAALERVHDWVVERIRAS